MVLAQLCHFLTGQMRDGWEEVVGPELEDVGQINWGVCENIL